MQNPLKLADGRRRKVEGKERRMEGGRKTNIRADWNRMEGKEKIDKKKEEIKVT